MTEKQNKLGSGAVAMCGVDRPFESRNGWVRDVVPWDEPVDGAELLDELTATLRRFVVLPNFGTEAMALWILHTYAFELRDVSTYVGIESPEKRCGKTTLLGLLSELVNRPVVAANISSPAFFRVIEETRPTLLIDEADTFLQGNDELRGILNSGYSNKTAFVVRMANEVKGRGESESERRTSNFQLPTSNVEREEEKGEGSNLELRKSGKEYVQGNGGMRLVRFSSWCPKAVAAIGRLPETLADRCIVIRMQRKTVAEKCERLKRLEGEVLRRKCARFVLDHAEEIRAAQPVMPEGLNDRAADIWEPLFVIADLAGWDLFNRKERRERKEGETRTSNVQLPTSDIERIGESVSDSGVQPRMDTDGHGSENSKSETGTSGSQGNPKQIQNSNEENLEWPQKGTEVTKGNGENKGRSESESGNVELLSPALSSAGRREGEGQQGAEVRERHEGAGIANGISQIANGKAEDGARRRESESESESVELLSPALSSPGRREGDGARGAHALPLSSRKGWGVIAREAAMGLTGAAQQAHPIGSFLVDVMVAFEAARAEKLFSRELVARLLRRGLRPWAELTRGRELNELMLAQILRGYGVRPRTLWIDGQVAKGYVKGDFDEVFRRYIPRSEFEALREEIMPESERAAFERRKKEEEMVTEEHERRKQELEAELVKMRAASTSALLGKLARLGKG